MAYCFFFWNINGDFLNSAILRISVLETVSLRKILNCFTIFYNKVISISKTNPYSVYCIEKRQGVIFRRQLYFSERRKFLTYEFVPFPARLPQYIGLHATPADIPLSFLPTLNFPPNLGTQDTHCLQVFLLQWLLLILHLSVHSPNTSFRM